MEIVEIVSSFLNPTSNILEVTFRTMDDNDDVIRTDNINYNISKEYGYELMSESFDFFDDDFDEDELDNEKFELDDDELISFLNEYYEVNPNNLPSAEVY
jgi:isopropylmalate/homocitrate/citramalate synthase